ncbi:nitroreductase/quinone reductase family protein [Actinomadura kijaniata]|uniref:nitroreductase/quinone reductase family protein n=1 Tax=Actinomadura kijaniata TaxID=46161 RepID=UPI003F1C1DF4
MTGNAIDRLMGSPHWRGSPPRLAPGGPAELGRINRMLDRAAGWVMGTDGMRLVQVIGRDRALLRAYLRFANRLVVRGRLPRADVELVTLRTAWNCAARYEFLHHAYLSRLGGLSAATLERVAAGPSAPGWNERQAALLTAADELHADRIVSDPTWDRLTAFLDDRQLVGLCLLVGHYEMLAMLFNSAGVDPEPGAWRRGPLRWLRHDDDSDARFPRRSAHVSRRLTGPVMAARAPLPPPLAVIVHRGRSTGREYRTPVTALVRDGRLVVPLGHGTRADWVRNLLHEGRGGVERAGRPYRITAPRVTDMATDGHLVPGPLRPLLRPFTLLVADLEPR